jgi:hypothetical protein
MAYLTFRALLTIGKKFISAQDSGLGKRVWWCEGQVRFIVSVWILVVQPRKKIAMSYEKVNEVW